MVKVKACTTAQLRPGEMLNFNLLDHVVLVANVDGQFFAIDGICSDAGGNLARGELLWSVVECPRHFARFDLRTGKVVRGPQAGGGKAHDLRSYPISVEGDCVIVDV